jgi:hypothetical protein
LSQFPLYESWLPVTGPPSPLLTFKFFLLLLNSTMLKSLFFFYRFFKQASFFSVFFPVVVEVTKADIYVIGKISMTPASNNTVLPRYQLHWRTIMRLWQLHRQSSET